MPSLSSESYRQVTCTEAAWQPAHCRASHRAGLEGRTCEVFIKGSRGDFDQLPDNGVDDISERVTYRPSRLFVRST